MSKGLLLPLSLLALMATKARVFPGFLFSNQSSYKNIKHRSQRQKRKAQKGRR